MARLMKNSDGFTIVEVAVTLVVIGIFSIVILMMQTQVSARLSCSGLPFITASPLRPSISSVRLVRRPAGLVTKTTPTSTSRIRAIKLMMCFSGAPI